MGLSAFTCDHHKHRGPMVVDPKIHYPLAHGTIYFRNHAFLPSSEDFDRHHGIFVRLLPPEHGWGTRIGRRSQKRVEHEQLEAP